MLSGSLKELDLSYNQLSEIQWSIPRLVRLAIINLSHNNIKELPPPTWWMCSQLEELNLSHNLLDNFDSDESLVSDGAGSLSPRNEKKGRQRISQSGDVGHELIQKKHKENVEFPVKFFKHSLKRLKLDNNRLIAVPNSICGLSALSQLTLSKCVYFLLTVLLVVTFPCCFLFLVVILFLSFRMGWEPSPTAGRLNYKDWILSMYQTMSDLVNLQCCFLSLNSIEFCHFQECPRDLRSVCWPTFVHSYVSLFRTCESSLWLLGCKREGRRHF